MDKIEKEDLLLIKFYQSQIENQKLKMELAKARLENMEMNYKLSVNSFNTYMRDIYKKYELPETAEISEEGEIVNG